MGCGCSLPVWWTTNRSSSASRPIETSTSVNGNLTKASTSANGNPKETSTSVNGNLMETSSTVNRSLAGTPAPVNGIIEYHDPNLAPPIHDLMDDIQQQLSDLWELKKKHSNSSNSNTPIVFLWELEKLWTPYYTQFYTRQDWHKEWSKTDKIKREYIKIVSILILANFNDWSRFQKDFIDTPERKDENLPFKLEELKKPDFLGRIGLIFEHFQWAFCPLVIEQRRDPYIKNPLQPFPFVDERKKIGSGAAGIVFKQRIAPGHLRYANGAINEKIKRVAVKEVDDDEVDHVEFDTLKQLRQLLARHDRIMVNLATIQIESSRPDSASLPNHELLVNDRPSAKGTKHMMFYDLADYDLRDLLTRRRYSSPSRRNSDHEKDRQMRHNSPGPRRHGSHDHQAYDLISESRNLADALDFLQNQLSLDGPLSLTHNDLRPENILVFYPDKDTICPVGQWKIADFGLAKFKIKTVKQTKPNTKKSDFLQPGTSVSENVEVDSTHRRRLSDTSIRRRVSDASTRSVSITTVKRAPGRHTAPEVQIPGEPQIDGRAGDIWSFGCIFAEVLAYSVAFHLVAELHQVCQSGFSDDKFYDQATGEVKDDVRQWLRALPSRFYEPAPAWVSQCVDLIEIILKKDPTKRPKAGWIRDRLRDIAAGMEKKDNFRLRDVPSLSGPCLPQVDTTTTENHQPNMSPPKIHIAEPDATVFTLSRTSNTSGSGET